MKQSGFNLGARLSLDGTGEWWNLISGAVQLSGKRMSNFKFQILHRIECMLFGRPFVMHDVDKPHRALMDM